MNVRETDKFLEGKAEGQLDAVRNLLESNAGSVEQIASWLKMPVEEVRRIAETVPVMK